LDYNSTDTLKNHDDICGLQSQASLTLQARLNQVVPKEQMYGHKSSDTKATRDSGLGTRDRP